MKLFLSNVDRPMHEIQVAAPKQDLSASNLHAWCRRMLVVLVLWPSGYGYADEGSDSKVVENQSVSRVEHFRDAKAVVFSSGTKHVLHPEALAKLDQLTIRGIKNATIQFQGEIKGKVPTKSHWQLDRGIVNFVECKNVSIVGLRAENLQRYEPVDGLGKNESTALNIAHSTGITISNSHLIGEGKGVVVVGGKSDVTIRDTTVVGYYFELQVGASDVRCENVTFNQCNKQVGDSHAAIWVSSTMRSELDKKLYKAASVVLKKHTFNMKTGRGIVAGNGAYDARSTLTFEDVPTINHQLRAMGLAVFHKNYHGIDVILRRPIPGLVDVVQANVAEPTIGKFVIYHETSGRPSSKAPIIVAGLSSDTVTP